MIQEVQLENETIRFVFFETSKNMKEKVVKNLKVSGVYGTTTKLEDVLNVEF